MAIGNAVIITTTPLPRQEAATPSRARRGIDRHAGAHVTTWAVAARQRRSTRTGGGGSTASLAAAFAVPPCVRRPAARARIDAMVAQRAGSGGEGRADAVRCFAASHAAEEAGAVRCAAVRRMCACPLRDRPSRARMWARLSRRVAPAFDGAFVLGTDSSTRDDDPMDRRITRLTRGF
jgi:hypothetical protein